MSQIDVKVIQKVVKNQIRVDIVPINPNQNMNQFFTQFAGKSITISVEEINLNCGSLICKSFGRCQGHWTEEELKANEVKVETTKTDGEKK